ncbi:helicase-related protein [Dictyobacter kobayashii]|uniref:Helicase C-terminal domain-containing protein n=1 Tax=Dictyobacter kobayashii TaxID=2014872 RepID=A0A402AVQ9_9CHLR|nr:helicase-related protein [Dictyobacter kobayashii]GCE23212.1 hypothetical protein KDK_70120 [Dictyobacter kobayashii]
MHAAASSPHALLHVLEVRIKQLQQQPALSFPEKISSNLISFTTPRLETQRITQVVNTVPTIQDEYSNYLDVLLWRTRTWQEQTEQELSRLSTSRGSLKTSSSHRLGQVLLALESVASSNKKAVVFSAWPQTLAVLIPHLRQRHGKAILAQFNASMPTEELQEEVNVFQESDRCRILLCDELGGEGRNFQIASQIIHIDLPWTPAQLEQRIGRVDRLGRQGSVLSIIPFAQEWPENDLFRIWQEAFQLFTQSMSGLEITLEGIQDALLEAIVERPRTGLANIIPNMIEQSTKLRKSVDEERYYEEVAVNRQLRDEFENISRDYSDGKKLRIPILKWADLCGLEHDYDPVFDIITYTPQRFNTVKRLNAKLFDFPNMEEALQRSGRRRELVLRGSFNRSVAVQREQLVFFAPSSDKWTDAIIANALESDRGRCCAIQRRLPDLKGTWEGVELLYSLAIDPRPLYAAGFDPTHLFRALGYLRSPLYRIVISLDGEVQNRNSPIWNTITKTPYSDSSGDIHMGRRDESHWGSPQIQKFKQQHPPEEWSTQLNTILSIAENDLAEELAFMQDEADIAQSDFTQRAAGLRAADLWLQRASGREEQRSNPAIEEYKRTSEALVEGIRHPLHQLESVCFWRLEGKH